MIRRQEAVIQRSYAVIPEMETSMQSRETAKSSIAVIGAIVIVVLVGAGVYYKIESSTSTGGIEESGKTGENGTSGNGAIDPPTGSAAGGGGTEEITPAANTGSTDIGSSDIGTDAPDPELPPAIAVRTYHGKVVDPLGEELTGVSIRSGPFTTPDEATATTDAEGRFTISILADLQPLVRMSHPGYFQQIVELEKGREPSIPYLLFRGGLIRGRVEGPIVVEGGAIENAPVPDVVLEFAGMEGWFDQVTTDDDGRYEMTAPFGPVVITVRTVAYRDEQILDVESSREKVVEHDILLVPGIRLEVVLFGIGEAVADAHLRVFTGRGLEGEGRSNALGKAAFTGLTPGRGKVVVVSPGYRAEMHALILGENRALIRKPISLDPSTPWTLEVVDSDGNARPDANVRIKLDRIELVNALAGDSKALDILGRERNYAIDITAPDAPRTRVRFRIPTEGPPLLRVRLPRGGRFAGVVVDTLDRPIAGAGVLITPTGGTDSAQGPPRLTSTSLDGSFRTELFAPGPYRVQVQHPKLGRSSVDTRIVEGEDRDVGKIKIE